MNTKKYIELFDELDNEDQLQPVLNNGRKQNGPPRNPKKMSESDSKFLSRQDDSSRSFKYTYKAARFEEWWLLESLGAFYEHKWIDDVLRRLKGGKEASVYLCRGNASTEPLVTAKVYRPRSLRNLKNDGIYRTGRTDLDEDGNAIVKLADVHAIHSRSRYGEELRHQSWIAYEFQTLEMLHEAGADVPKPYAMEKNAILMEYIGDDGNAAPTLNNVRLARGEARGLFDRLILNLNLLLDNDRIHGDLSAYNILYWEGDITLIDFPQVVHPGKNPSAWVIFLRDVTRICQYFTSQGVKTDAHKLASELWTAHGHKVVEEVEPSHLDADDPNDRKLWERQKEKNTRV